MPFQIEPTDIIVIILLAMLIFGSSRLPEIGRGLGRSIVEFRKGIHETTGSYQEENSPSAGHEPPVLTSPPQRESAVATGADHGNFCTQCGAPNPHGAKFCNQCGQSIMPLD